MRIIAGKFKGRRLAVESVPTLRPTSDRVREALFSMLEARLDLEGASVIDLYAGSGALGLEALSRGAASACFVENNPRAVSGLRHNCAGLGVESQCSIIAMPVESFLSSQRCELSEHGGFSVAFADPPYAQHPGNDLLQLIVNSHLLARGGFLVIEARKGMVFDENFSCVEADATLIKVARYGDSQVALYCIE